MRGFAGKLGVFALLLVVLQVLVSVAFPAPLPKEILDLDKHLGEGADIVYLGDSTLFYPVGEVTTGQILQEALPEQRIGEVSHPAYGLDLYASYVQYIVGSQRRNPGGRRPQAVVLPINMRSFSPEWDRRPGYQFEKEKKVLALGPVLASILVRPLEILGAFEPGITQDAFLDTVVYDGETPVGMVRDFESLADEDLAIGDGGFAYHDALPSEDDQEALQRALIYHYMFRLEEGHRKLEAIRQIARLCQENGLDVILYIAPVNYQQGERVLGSAFRERLVENVAVLSRVIQSELERVGTEHVTLLDLSLGLEAYAFVDMEHLQETGKAYVAEQLASAVADKLDPGAVTVLPEPVVEATATHTVEPVVSPTAAMPTATQTPQATTTPSRVVIQPTERVTHTPSAMTPTMTATTAALSTPVGTTETPISGTATVTVTVAPEVPFELVEDEGPKPGTVTDARFVAHFKPSGKYAVDQIRVRLRTINAQAATSASALVEVQADIYIPRVTGDSSFPVLVYAAGTTGLDEGCAPLDEQIKKRNWGNYQGHSLAYAAQGYLVVLPNGLGFDDAERIHPYFVAELQAHVLLDAARAVYDLYDSEWLKVVGDQADDTPGQVEHPAWAEPSRAVFLMGYSSGGHAIFAAKDYAIRYAPDLVVKGVIGHGPTTNVETLLREDAVFSPYIVYAYRDFYGSDVIDPADVFAPQWVSTFESDVMTKCVDDIFEYYSRSARVMYSTGFRNILYGDKLAQEFPLFAEKLKENYVGVSGGAHIPVLILQGTGDTVVTPPSQKKFMSELCAMGTAVAYWEYPAVPHTEIRRVSFSDTLVWMRGITQGAAARSDCLEQAP